MNDVATDASPPAHQPGGLRIDRATGEVWGPQGTSLRLSPIHMAVLDCLVGRQGEVVSRAALFEQAWPNQVVSDDVLTRAISDLRQRLKAAFGPQDFIETLPKRGYRWVGETTIDPVARPTSEPAGDAGRRSTPARLAAYLIAALLLASVFVWVLDALTAPVQFRVAIFPPDTARTSDALSHELDELLSDELMKIDRLEFLSPAAIAARPAQPFPYLHTELGADRAVESRLRVSESGRYLLTISVVDARTGIVGLSRSMEVEGNRAGLAGGVRRMVSEVRPALQSSTLP